MMGWAFLTRGLCGRTAPEINPMKTTFSTVRLTVSCMVWLTACTLPTRGAVTLTENRLLAAGDLSLDGQELIVDAATLTVAGSHTFASLQLRNGAVVKHPPAPSGQAGNAIRIVVAGNVTIDAKSRVDATGLGYGEAASPGAATRGDFAGAGGGHGGRGDRKAHV